MKTKTRSRSPTTVVLEVVHVKALSGRLLTKGADLEAFEFLQTVGLQQVKLDVDGRHFRGSPPDNAIFLCEYDDDGSVSKPFRLVRIKNQIGTLIDTGRTLYIVDADEDRIEINVVGDEMRDWVVTCRKASEVICRMNAALKEQALKAPEQITLRQLKARTERPDPRPPKSITFKNNSVQAA